VSVSTDVTSFILCNRRVIVYKTSSSRFKKKRGRATHV